MGAGGAGVGVLVQLAQRRRPDAEPLTVAVVDPVHRAGRDRTWCFWDAGSSPVDAAIHRQWRTVLLVDEHGASHRLDLDPLRYVMVRSQDLYALADKAAADLGAIRVEAAATAVVDGEDRAVVRTDAGDVEARWVLDSRPAPPRRPPTTALLQHFRGWMVRFPADVLDPSAPVFMDFAVPRPASGVAFGYVLPDDARTGLVEYTEFSAAAPHGRRLRRGSDPLPGGPVGERVRDRGRRGRCHPHDRRRTRAARRASRGAPGRGGRRHPRLDRLHLRGDAAAGGRGRGRAARRDATRCRRPPTRRGTDGWTPCSCVPSTAGWSTARRCSPGCCSATRRSGSCGSSTAPRLLEELAIMRATPRLA